jgi:four helix bundle protein
MNDECQRPKGNLRDCTRAFALAIIDLYVSLPQTAVAQVLGKQLLRSGTSVGAHWREAHWARSTAEFVSKVEGGLQELDETTYWLELMTARHIGAEDRICALHDEAEQLLMILVASARTAKARD